MNTHTCSLAIATSKKEVYSYLSNIENLPKWATEFCKELKFVDGDYKVSTPAGELFVEYRVDEKTGVIDIYAGPSKDQMAVFATRVVELSPKSSSYLFTCFQAPEMRDEIFLAQYESLERELENVRNAFAA